ncbi:phytanoyl-CoA dioxygenase family protein [uncultured Tateyamaria sp.]|uniref:phytanoyl-CoA dioxygenase family protein n=1 Tax=uncultured Tateyamaria sp. TaxID=455651 RepID=UPI00261DCFF7|nr:phytanoyl-CoA dioxygenase family protein [uncultured Tateyamaria sp.]
MLDTITLENGHLTGVQQAQYWRDGFLFPLPAISPKAALTARTELEDVEATWREADLPHPLNTYKRVNAHVVMPMAARVAQDPAILDVIEGILGPDILIYSTEFFIKEPNTRQIVSMHQDLTYWGLGAIDGLVTAWIALSPATPASGCMDFVAASHKNAILEHEDSFDPDNLLSRGQEVKVDVKPEDKTAIEIHPGQMSLHHGLTIHGSGPNTSDDRRIACVVRYIRPDMAQEVGGKDYAMHARGTDTHGNFIHVPVPEQNFAPEALTLYDEIRDQQARVMMKGAKGSTEIYA